MGLAKELVDQQMFFRRELSERVAWFIGLRWIAVVAAVLTLTAAAKLALPLAFGPITAVIFSIAAYNILFGWICRRLRRLSAEHEKPFAICAHAQIGCDLIALYILIYFTGGILSPLLIFALFHVILAGILLEPLHAYVYAGILATVTGLLAYLQYIAVLPPPPKLFANLFATQPLLARDALLAFGVPAIAFGVTAYLVTTIKRSLRTKGRTLLVFCKELEAANAKLTALYVMVKQMAECTDWQQLMDAATRETTRIMGVKACSIKLLDDRRQTLRFASTYGLSEDYLSTGAIDIAKSPINQRIIEGAGHAIGDIAIKDHFQYPENIHKEGIAAMVCLPLKVEKRVLGVFCVYSHTRYHFSDSEVAFFVLVTELTALAMQNLKSELNKDWFLQKAAHQLRSPLAAVDTTLKVLRKAYAGPLSDRQRDLLLQCERRIGTLGKMIQDLLTIGIRRADENAPPPLAPLMLEPLIRQLAAVFETEAAEKGVALTIAIAPQLPAIMGTAQLVDDLFTNLLSNAIKYTPAGRTVEVSLQRNSHGRVALEITDSGIGIPEEQLPRLFTEFFRAENAKALTEQGTGLGLVIVKEAVDRLGATIRIDSRENQGTRVICRFPAAEVRHAPCAIGDPVGLGSGDDSRCGNRPK